MFCKSCGNKIDDDSQFCSYCGTKQSKINKVVFENENVIEQEKSKTNNLKNSLDLQNNTKPDKSLNNVDNESKYDPTYSKETEATIVGTLILVSLLLCLIFQPFEFNNIESYNQFRAISSIVSLIFRFLIVIWVVNIAKRQNRKTFGWGLFAFFFPSISLIIIGLLKKIKYKIKIDPTLTPLETFYALDKEADDFIKHNRNKEAELIYEYIFKNYELNESTIFKLAELYFKNKKYNESESLLNQILDSEKYSDISNYYLGFISMKKGNIVDALEHLEFSSKNNFSKSTILKNIILQDKIQKIDFETQKNEFGINAPTNSNQINIQIETISYFELRFNYSSINLEIFENYLVIKFFNSILSSKKETFIISYRMIKNLERIEHNKFTFIFNDGNKLDFEIDSPLDIAKEYQKTIDEKILYFKSNYR